MSVSSPADALGRGELLARSAAPVLLLRLRMRVLPSRACRRPVMWLSAALVTVEQERQYKCRQAGASRSMDDRTEIAIVGRQGDGANANGPDSPAAPGADRARSAVIEAAAAVLAQRNPDIPQHFIADLFGRAAPED